MTKAKDHSPVAKNRSTEDLIGEATALQLEGRFDDSIATAKKILRLKNISDENTLSVRMIIGHCYSHKGHNEEALAVHNETLRLAEKLKNESLICKSLFSIGSSYIRLANYKYALQYLSQALLIAEKESDTKLLSGILHNLGSLYRCISDYPKALDYLSRTLILAQTEDDKLRESQALTSIGLVYFQMSDNEKALKYYFRALEMSEEIGTTSTSCGLLGNIGSVYNHLRDYPKALKYHSRAAVAAEKLGANEILAVALGNTGVDLKYLDDYPQALHYFQRALELSYKIGAQRLTGFWMFAIAQIDHKQGNLDSSQRGLIAAMQHMRNLSTNEHVADILVELGNVLMEKGEVDQAFLHLVEAIQLADRLGEKLPASNASKALSEIYQQKGDVASAYQYLHKHLTIEKELFGEEVQKRIESFTIEKAFELEAKEKEIEKMKVTKLEQDLANTTINLAMQTELLGNFRNDLRQIVREIDEPMEALKKIKEKLKTLPCEQIDWVKFEKQFTEVHPEFKTKLVAKYPDLTKQEVKMCQLARLGLKNFEMSRLLCLSERTVEGHRLNLRKKLGVKTEEKLSEFLGNV